MTDLNNFATAMAIDEATGKPMPKMQIAGTEDNGGSGALPTNIKQADAMVGVDVQAKRKETKTLINAETVASGATVVTSWIDTEILGFDKIVLNLAWNATIAHSVKVRWSENGTTTRSEEVFASVTEMYQKLVVETGLQHIQIEVKNEGATSQVLTVVGYYK